MVDNSTPFVGPLATWVIAAQAASGGTLTAEAASFPWSWDWQREPLLDATGNRFAKRPGGMGSGSFTILRDERQEPESTKLRNFPSNLVAGQYVCVTCDQASITNGRPTANSVLWWGWISSLSYAQVAGTLDGIGVAQALEVGHLLDQQQVTNWGRVSSDGSYIEVMGTPPTANMGDATTYVIGNAKGPVKISPAGEAGYAFARLPEDCGTAAAKLWTRWRLLRHLLLACKTTGLPPITLVCADGSEDLDPSDTSTIAGFLNDTSTPEVYDLRNLTFKGAIDMCVPQSRGFNWTLELVDEKNWQLVIYSYAASGGAGGLPVNTHSSYFSYTSGTGQDLTEDALTTEVQVINDSGTMPDEIWIEGGTLVWGCTVSYADKNLKEGWQRGSGNQEDFYRKAANTASDYSTLSYSTRLERNAAVRSSPGLRDVYTRYCLATSTDAAHTGDVRLLNPPGNGSGNDVPLCPELTWNGSALAIGSISRVPYLPTATLLRTLPWPEGVKGDGTDLRPSVVANFPQFLHARLFRYDSSNTILPWIDFQSKQGRSGQLPLHLDVDDRGAAIRINVATPEYLALNHWTDAAGGTTSPAMSEISTEGGNIGSTLALDYSKLVATVGIESDQRVLVKTYRPGVTTASQVRRRMILRDPDLQCWIMRKNTVIGLLDTGQPERVTSGGSVFSAISGPSGSSEPGGILVRNDWPVAQRRANMAASWVFRKRTSVRIERASPDVPPVYARIGFLLTSIIEQQVDRLHTQQALTVNTVVEDVTFDFSLTRPRLAISTTMPGMVGFAPVRGGASPNAGGSVSLSLGGTVSQAVQGQQQATSALAMDTQRVAVTVPLTGPPAPYRTVIVRGGNTIDGQAGIKTDSSTITDIPTAYNPNASPACIDGVGYGDMYENGIFREKVLVVNDARSTLGIFLLNGDQVYATPTTVTVGGGPTTAIIYLAG